MKKFSTEIGLVGLAISVMVLFIAGMITKMVDDYSGFGEEYITTTHNFEILYENYDYVMGVTESGDTVVAYAQPNRVHHVLFKNEWNCDSVPVRSIKMVQYQIEHSTNKTWRKAHFWE